ncbi:MAG: hypothetical protein V2A79_05040 [Planctomycetota bacterium]
MSRKHAGKGKAQEGSVPQRNSSGGPASQPGATRHLTPLSMVLGVAVLVLAVALVWALQRPSGGKAMPTPQQATAPPAGGTATGTLPSDTGSTTRPSVGPSITVTPAGSPQPPAPPGTKAPINDMDPMTGKAVTAISPTVVYKGHVIAFCCDKSTGYNGGWEQMSEAEKDAFVQRYVK